MALVLAMSLVASACGGGDSQVAAGGGDRLDSSVLSGEATTWTGEAFDLSTLADKDLVVWFWAPW